MNVQRKHTSSTLSFQDSMFRATLLAFVNRFSHWLTVSHGDIHDVNVTEVTSHHNVTVVDVYIISPATNGEN